MIFDLLLFPCGAYFFRVLFMICKTSSLAKYDYVDYFEIFMLLVGKKKTLKTKRNMGVNQSFWPDEGKKFNVIQNDLEFSACSNGCFD